MRVVYWREETDGWRIDVCRVGDGFRAYVSSPGGRPIKTTLLHSSDLDADAAAMRIIALERGRAARPSFAARAWRGLMGLFAPRGAS